MPYHAHSGVYLWSHVTKDTFIGIGTGGAGGALAPPLFVNSTVFVLTYC